MAKPDEASRLTDAELAKLERRVARVYQEARDDLQKTVDDYFERFKERDAEMKALIGTVQNGRVWTENDYKQWRLNQIARGKRFEALRDKMAERYTNANVTAMSYVNDKTPGIYSLNRNYSAYVIDKATGGGLTLGPDGETLNADFILFDEQTVRRLIVEEPDVMPYYPPERAVQRGIDLAYGKSQITKNVTSGILQGLSVKQMSDALQERVQTMERNSAIRAVRTSVTAAQNAGRMDSYRAAQNMGIKLKKRWLATLDGRTRHSHRQLDGETRETDEAFSNGCMYPGDPRGAPHETYNCRCTLIASLPDFDLSPGERRARGATADAKDKSSVVIEDMTYSEWAGWVKKPLANPVKSGIMKMSQVDESFSNLVRQETGMTEDYATILEKRFEKGTEIAKRIFKKYVNGQSVADGNFTEDEAHFDVVETKKIYMNYEQDRSHITGSGCIFFHEHGHYIDYYSCPAFIPQGLTSSRTSKFSELIKADFEALVSKKIISAHCSREKAYQLIKEDFLLNPIETHAVSDICGGLTHNKCVGEFGHLKPDDYWDVPGRLESETFAHMFQAQFFPSHLHVMRQYFPRALKEFERLLTEMVL